MVERRILDFKDPDDGIERTAIADMAKFSVLDVISGGALRLGDRSDVGHRNVEKLSKRVDEATDQPWASDAVDLRMLARDPFVLDCTQLLSRRQTGLLPSRNATFEIGGLDAG